MECGRKYITRSNGLVNMVFLNKLQVAFLSQRGVKACFITPDQQDDGIKDGVVQGLYQLVYFTPEMLLGSKRWRKVLLNNVYSSRLRAFIVDEAHTVAKW